MSSWDFHLPDQQSADPCGDYRRAERLQARCKEPKRQSGGVRSKNGHYPVGDRENYVSRECDEGMGGGQIGENDRPDQTREPTDQSEGDYLRARAECPLSGGKPDNRNLRET